MKHKLFYSAAMFLVIVSIRAIAIGAIWHVDTYVSTSGDGTSWSEAFKTIQEAVDASTAGDELWVKRGVYSVSSEISVQKNIAIYGGFDGSETQRSDRDWSKNITVVDGQGAYRCYFLRADATLDGFTITNGSTAYGGGGIFISSSSPVITNCIFRNNQAGSNGGGAMHSWNASPIITNSIFSGNSGGSNGGGAIFNWDCPNVTITNCTFTENDGGASGGAVYNYNSSVVLTNNILWNDQASSGSEVYNDDSTLNISHCDLSRGVTGIVNIGGMVNDDGTNIEIDPLMDTTYHLQADSVCIDKGTNSAPAIPTTDIDGEARIRGAFCDIGADEFPLTKAYFVSTLGSDSNDCLSTTSPCRTIQHTINVANGTENLPVILHIAAGFYEENIVMESWESLEGGWNNDFSQQWDFENNGLEPDATFETIIDGDRIGTCITQFEINNANIYGLTIQNGTGPAGGIYLNNSSPNVTNCIIKDNFGDSDGDSYNAGGMYNHQSNPKVVNCSFIGNIPDESYLPWWSAAAVLNNHSQGTFMSCRIYGKFWIGGTGSISTGMVNVHSTPIISKCTFEENRGGSYLYPPLVNENSSLIITNCIFLRNLGDEADGAGILNLDSHVTISNSSFIGNIHQAADGNAMVIDNWSSECIISNCTFAGNRISSYNLERAVVSSHYSDVVTSNSIFWENLGQSLLSDTIFYPSSFAFDEFSTLDVSHSDVDQDGFEGIAGNIRLDPKFVQSGWDNNGTPDDVEDDVWIVGDYHLQQDSPCIDAGNNAALPPDNTDLDNDGDKTEPIPLDLDGEPRINYGVADMGAYEYHPGCLCDFEPSDGDVDGVDLVTYAQGNTGMSLENLATEFGKIDCLY